MMAMMDCHCDILTILIATVIISTIHLIKNINTSPICNVYKRTCRFYWIKIAFMYLILKLKQARDKKKAKISTDDYLRLDKPQKLSAHDKAIDGVYINGAGSQGDFLVSGMARRKNNLIDGFLYLKIANSNLGLLETPKLPDTSLYQNETELEEHSAEGIAIGSIEPMRKWKITYKGTMKQHYDPKKTHSVELNALWTSNLPYFNFDTDMDPLAMAKSMAKEPWSREYFKTLKEIHQTHYEQHGDVKGTAVIDGQSYSIDIKAVRDHTIGDQREWRNLHRYCLHFFSTENGDRFNVGMICMPMAFSRLTVGYVYCARNGKIYPVKSCDLQMYQHGENGAMSTDYSFTCETEHETYRISVHVLHSPAFYLSKDRESRVVENLCKFKVNESEGWGAAEWQYRNVTGQVLDESNKQ